MRAGGCDSPRLLDWIGPSCSDLSALDARRADLDRVSGALGGPSRHRPERLDGARRTQVTVKALVEMTVPARLLSVMRPVWAKAGTVTVNR